VPVRYINSLLYRIEWNDGDLYYQSYVVKQRHARFVGAKLGQIQQRVESKPGRIIRVTALRHQQHHHHHHHHHHYQHHSSGVTNGRQTKACSASGRHSRQVRQPIRGLLNF